MVSSESKTIVYTAAFKTEIKKKYLFSRQIKHTKKNGIFFCFHPRGVCTVYNICIVGHLVVNFVYDGILKICIRGHDERYRRAPKCKPGGVVVAFRHNVRRVFWKENNFRGRNAEDERARLGAPKIARRVTGKPEQSPGGGPRPTAKDYASSPVTNSD